MDFKNNFMRNDQPTTCPYCGVRTGIILELPESLNQSQIHRCHADNCKLEFVEEFDANYSKINYES